MITMRFRGARVSLVVLLAGLTIAVPGAEVAFAAAPTISSFTPTSGPVGTSVKINGDNFTGSDPDVTSVKFNGVSATFTINNPQHLTATVPAGATTGPISVTNADGTATSATNFTVTAAAVPTITSFNPTSGPVGTSVVITGTNFTGATSVSFNNVNATTFKVNPAGTRITVTVPTGATTGPIKVTTPSGTATSATNFTVITVSTHSRSVTLSLRRHLVARGMVSVTDGFTACAASVPVKIQRRVSGHWKTVGSTTTSASGAYKKRIRDRSGRYRARATRVALNSGADVCSRATSPVRRHTH